jgi:RHS repeat-associated protein
MAAFLVVASSSVLATPTSYYIYDESGHVIGEYDTNGNPVQEHVYLGDRPVAVVAGGSSGGGTVDYVTTDQLDAPRVITDGSKTVLWAWNSDPFGNGQPMGSLDGNVPYNLRFPGQYYDAETGHNYNYYRDYDPQAGRYIESDPFGLKAGLNTYTYVDDMPLELIDRFGLFGANGSWGPSPAALGPTEPVHLVRGPQYRYTLTIQISARAQQTAPHILLVVC